MKKQLFFVFFFVSIFAVTASEKAENIKDNNNQAVNKHMYDSGSDLVSVDESMNEDIFSCLADAIMIYEATLARTGDRARSLDNANAFFDDCENY